MFPLLVKGATSAIFSLILASCSLSPMSKAAPASTKVNASPTGDKQINNDNMSGMGTNMMNMD